MTGERFFSFPQNLEWLCDLSIHFLSSGYQGQFPRGIKQLGLEVDHSLLSSAEVKDGGVTPLLPYTFSWYSD
jgi:hypothetical protein